MNERMIVNHGTLVWKETVWRFCRGMKLENGAVKWVICNGRGRTVFIRMMLPAGLPCARYSRPIICIKARKYAEPFIGRYLETVWMPQLFFLFAFRIGGTLSMRTFEIIPFCFVIEIFTPSWLEKFELCPLRTRSEVLPRIRFRNCIWQGSLKEVGDYLMGKKTGFETMPSPKKKERGVESNRDRLVSNHGRGTRAPLWIFHPRILESSKLFSNLMWPFR